MYRVEFKWSGKTYPVIIPPTYLHHTDKEALDILSLHLGNHGYSVYETELPAKLLAVRCGLAKYGRNNIAYIDGWGSFFRLRVFFSDMPCDSDNWQEMKMMDRCNTCTACSKNCPTRAITDERFLVNAGRCLTFFNEGASDFPGWLDPAWHNCLMGCMSCQDVCPENKDFFHWFSDAERFSEDETLLIIEGVPKEKLPGEFTDKLKRIYMWDDYNLLQRNLSMLIR
jgi:epoxyqueuosine reductase